MEPSQGPENKKASGEGRPRADRIRDEIIAAKKSGIQAPFQVSTGETFRSETTSRPLGAISVESENASLVGGLNRDYLSSQMAPPQSGLAEAILRQAGDDPNMPLMQLENAVRRVSQTASPQTLRAIGEQVNLASVLNPDDKRIARVRTALDDFHYGPVDIDALEQGSPGGGVKRS